MPVPPRTLTVLRRLARTVGSTADDTVRAITASWLASWQDLTPAWQAAITAIADDYTRTGAWPAAWQVARIEAVARATDRTRRSLDVLLAGAEASNAAAVSAAGRAGWLAEPQLIASQVPRLTLAEIAMPPIAAADEQRRRRINGLHRGIHTDTAALLPRALQPIPNPDRAAITNILFDRIRTAFDAPLTRAVTVARTEPVDAARTAAQLVDLANPALVSAWAWICQCDRRSCIACWAMHGRQFPITQDGPEGHGGCRCQRLPLAGDTTLPTAERRFRRLSRRDQQQILGPGRYTLLQSGAVGWADLAVRRSNPGWRDSHVPRPVADLKRLAARQGTPTPL